MARLSLKSVFVALGLLIPAAAPAATVNLDYLGGTSNGSITITSAPAGTPAHSLPWTVGAYGFNMKDTTGQMGTFVAFCLDITHYLSSSSTYQTTTTPFTNSYGLDASQMARVQRVFDANYATVLLGNAAQAAGFQAALWNALYDTDWTLSGGSFAAQDGTSGARSAGNSFLTAAMNYSGAKKYNMTFLQSMSYSQNLVTVAPVPLPAAGLLLLGALAGLGVMRRRKDSAAQA